MKSSYVIWLLYMLAINVHGQAIITRMQPYCGMFKNQIAVCYSGITGNSTSHDIADTIVYMFDFKRNATIAELASGWKVLNTNTAGVDIVGRYYAGSAAISDHELLISGGVDLYSDRLKDQTIVYDLDSNSWKSYPPYIEGEFGNRQIYTSSQVYVPGKGLAFYGGQEINPVLNWTIPTNQNLTKAFYESGDLRVIGYVSLVYLDINNKENPWTTPAGQNPPTVYSSSQSNVFYDNKIYYFGGKYHDIDLPDYSTTYSSLYHPFTYALVFDTLTNTWSNQSLSGSIIPSPRRYHTTTLLPNEPDVVLLYGGEVSTVVSDYCFTLDLKTFTWNQVKFNTTSDPYGIARSSHSALLVDNNTLLLAFGANSLGILATSPVLLNITDSKSISYLESYTYYNPNGTTTPTDEELSKGGISIGAIIGIVVGILVVVIFGLVGFYFYHRNKKREEEHKEYKNAVGHEQLEVNWDEIEKQYDEVPSQAAISQAAPKYQAPHSVDNDLSTVYSDGQSQPSRPSQNKAHVIPDAIEEHTFIAPPVLKPDGGGL